MNMHINQSWDNPLVCSIDRLTFFWSFYYPRLLKILYFPLLYQQVTNQVGPCCWINYTPSLYQNHLR